MLSPELSSAWKAAWGAWGLLLLKVLKLERGLARHHAGQGWCGAWGGGRGGEGWGARWGPGALCGVGGWGWCGPEERVHSRRRLADGLVQGGSEEEAGAEARRSTGMDGAVNSLCACREGGLLL